MLNEANTITDDPIEWIKQNFGDGIIDDDEYIVHARHYDDDRGMTRMTIHIKRLIDE